MAQQALPNAATKNWSGWASAAIAAVALLGAALWFVARLDARVSAIETTASADRGSSVNCAELAGRVAEAYRAGNQTNVAEPLERLMDRLGCGSDQQKRPPIAG